MIFIDRREGSADVMPYLAARSISSELIELPVADAMFMGKGPEGLDVSVGIEIKALGDMVTCLRDGRFVDNQLPDLTTTYDVVWVVIEGIWTGDEEDYLINLVDRTKDENKGKTLFGFWSKPKAGFRGVRRREVEGHLFTLIQKVGLGRKFYVWRTINREDTAQFIGNLYRWWGNDWEDHQSHEGMYQGAWEQGSVPGSVQLNRPSFMQRVAAVFPKIGWKKSKEIADHFKELSVQELVCLEEEEWAKVPGIGKGIARHIVAALTTRRAG